MELKYATITKTVRGYTHLAAFPSLSGVDTLDSLFNWESRDEYNRMIYLVKTKEAAIELLKTFK